MTSFQESLLRTKSSLAIDAAVSPAKHAAECQQWQATPVTREEVLQEFGEQAALAWDDLQSAAAGFRKAVDRKLERDRDAEEISF